MSTHLYKTLFENTTLSTQKEVVRLPKMTSHIYKTLLITTELTSQSPNGTIGSP